MSVRNPMRTLKIKKMLGKLFSRARSVPEVRSWRCRLLRGPEDASEKKSCARIFFLATHARRSNLEVLSHWSGLQTSGSHTPKIIIKNCAEIFLTSSSGARTLIDDFLYLNVRHNQSLFSQPDQWIITANRFSTPDR